MQNFKAFLQTLPLGIVGLAFGICSLGWNWAAFYPQLGTVQIFAALIAVSMIILVLIKLICSSTSFWQQLTDPGTGPLLSIIPMSLMLASLNLPISGAQWLWGIAVTAQLLLLLGFTISRMQNFRLEKLSPTWFIPTVGIAVAPLTNPNLNTSLFDLLILAIAITAYFILLPLMIYRLLCKAPLARESLPALALFSAPPNLCLVGYLTLYPTPNIWFSTLLISLAITMTLFSYSTIIKQRQHAFSPAISAFTFPLVIGAAAMRSSSELFDEQILYSGLFSTLAYLQLLLASGIVLWVSYRYARHYS